MFRKCVAFALAVAATFLFGPVPAFAVGRDVVDFTTQSVSGTSGTSFVYFQAHASSGKTTTVPTRRFVGCPVPYLSLIHI